MAFKIESGPDILRVEFSGYLTTEDLTGIAEAVDQFERLAELAPCRLADLTPIIGATIGFAEVEALAVRRTAARLKRPVKTAIVAPTALQFGLAQMFQSLNLNPQIEVRLFRSRPEAEAWLKAANQSPPL